MVDSSQKMIKNSNENKKNFKDLVTQHYEPVVDMDLLAKQNKERKDKQAAERRAKEEKIASILHDESEYVMKNKLLSIISSQLNDERIAKLSGLMEMSPQKSPQPLSFFKGFGFDPVPEAVEQKSSGLEKVKCLDSDRR